MCGEIDAWMFVAHIEFQPWTRTGKAFNRDFNSIEIEANMSTHITWKKIRPSIAIECVRSVELGRCYKAVFFSVVTDCPLTKDQISALDKAGFLGCGQVFSFSFKTPDGQLVGKLPDRGDEPTGYDLADAIEVNAKTGEVVNASPINRNTGKPYEQYKYPYYMYSCERTIDSSD